MNSDYENAVFADDVLEISAKINNIIGEYAIQEKGKEHIVPIIMAAITMTVNKIDELDNKKVFRTALVQMLQEQKGK